MEISMNLEWMEMRIAEEHDRREREENIRRRLPTALEELNESLTECVQTYTAAFGQKSASIQFAGGRVRIEAREEVDGRWATRAEITISNDLKLPGFRIDRAGEPYVVEVGVLAGDNVFYRDGDDYITIEEVTRRILDRALFPKLVQ
jgi:hypothetical protein